MKTNSSYRILADLRACTGPCSGGRGIGNLSLFWFMEMLSCSEKQELFALVETNEKKQFPLSGPQGNRRVLFPTPPVWSSDRDWRGGEADSLSNAVYSSFVAPYRADVIHVAHAFEDYASQPAGLPYHAMHPRTQIIAATIYDFIPMIFPEYYFKNTDFKHFYLSRVQWLRQSDLLLAISDSTKNDAINIAGIDQRKIVVIPPCIDFNHYKPLTDKNDDRKKFLENYGIYKPFILYVGDDEYRKNLAGAIRAFALLPPELRKRHQLVIVCYINDGRKKELLHVATGLGLGAEDVVITGFVPHASLPLFYALCELFIFPSYYEGLGLPLLEAMACGAPVLAGDNSSQREIVGRSDALFDARNDDSIAGAMHNVLTDRDFRSTLCEYGIQRIQQICPNRPGKIILNVFEEALVHKRKASLTYIQSGLLTRKRMAVFTPLPGDRSGIADYAAFFLPYLAEYFDIDIYTTCTQLSCPHITSAFRVYDAKDFLEAAGAYEYILYEFGNSDFHAHMFELLERFPGVVTLHDAYLSGILHWMGRERFVQEALYSHGSLARRILLPSRRVDNADFEAIIKLPCTRRVLEEAVGVISHSRWNLELAHICYPEGLPSPYRIIPQAAKIAKAKSADERAYIKKSLRLPDNAIIIASYGHIAFTKMNDVVLNAFLNSKRLTADQRIYFVFVGQPGTDTYSVEFIDKVTGIDLSGRVRITGYISNEDYENYLSITDVAVQLRKDFRGGTPKGAMDALSHGIPVIMNKYAGDITDYSDSVVYMLTEFPNDMEIRTSMEVLVYNYKLRERLGEEGKKYIRFNNDPHRCAALYAAAIQEFYEYYSKNIKFRKIQFPAYHLNNDTDIKEYAKFICNIHNYKPNKIKLYIDVSYINLHDHKTGIQRVVREIVYALYCLDIQNIETIAVFQKNGKLFEAKDWLLSNGFISPEENMLPSRHILFSSGDILLMLDSSWGNYSEFIPIFEQAKINGASIYTVIYDILPLSLPDENWVDGGPAWFDQWLRKAVTHSDKLICISKNTADEVIHWIHTNVPDYHNIIVKYWHLGSDFKTDNTSNFNVPYSSRLKSKPFFLMAGTIEPRKNHALTLDAFEILWAKGYNLALCVAGKPGWLVDNFMEYLRTINLSNDNLVFIENPSDSELIQLYQNAVGLILPSKGEGFGLPIIEAARYGTPILCSDIPVFHEIAGDHAFYLNISSADAMAADIETWWKLAQEGQAPLSTGIPVLTWEESARQLLAAIGLIETTK